MLFDTLHIFYPFGEAPEDLDGTPESYQRSRESVNLVTTALISLGKLPDDDVESIRVVCWEDGELKPDELYVRLEANEPFSSVIEAAGAITDFSVWLVKKGDHYERA